MWTTWSLVRSGADQNSSRLVFLLVMTSICPVIPLTVVPITAATRLRDNNQYWCQSALDPYPSLHFPGGPETIDFPAAFLNLEINALSAEGKSSGGLLQKHFSCYFFIRRSTLPVTNVFFKNFYPEKLQHTLDFSVFIAVRTSFFVQ